MFTLYRIVNRSVAESVPDRASVHTRNAAFEAVSAPEQYCSAPLFKGHVHTVPDSETERLRKCTASVHTRNAGFVAVSAPEQYCFAPLLKVQHSVSDRFLKRSESSLNTFIGAEIATEPRFGKISFQIKSERCKLHNGWGFCSHWEHFETISAPQQNINSCSHCSAATFETEQKPIQYSVNIAKVERSVSDSFLRRSESSLNTSIGAEIATEPRICK